MQKHQESDAFTPSRRAQCTPQIHSTSPPGARLRSCLPEARTSRATSVGDLAADLRRRSTRSMHRRWLLFGRITDHRNVATRREFGSRNNSSGADAVIPPQHTHTRRYQERQARVRALRRRGVRPVEVVGGLWTQESRHHGAVPGGNCQRTRPRRVRVEVTGFEPVTSTLRT